MPPSLVPIHATRILRFLVRPGYVYEPQLPRMFWFPGLNPAPGVLLGNQVLVFLAFLTFSIWEITGSQGLGGRKVGVLSAPAPGFDLPLTQHWQSCPPPRPQHGVALDSLGAGVAGKVPGASRRLDQPRLFACLAGSWARGLSSPRGCGWRLHGGEVCRRCPRGRGSDVCQHQSAHAVGWCWTQDGAFCLWIKWRDRP